ncbi:putative ribosomal protein PSRP-3/Ycf65 [Helianthus annuus]|uniref:Ribosomal protein PSRP-3/Ycf65 n=1 Tax=Helianthus annuus TaxID=4232 RepID=A0A9K3HI58_HELAN|nr:putative ribosomal protein PSRP-3/Ycf65 [Helianthus annuus]KAJ0490058.1 putative ribosomal protein PSRP-3/Ycf65 [Helianthus annuus]KAJ0494141.1 putative ribosomal protein PSRP-3/Ycf65 [Helianthus annuus]KAJ0505972.1 putative ribosomal protein PSRP-3/Ycf65 [Helianthus annuus]KAJ0675642.1 putative ribosomal protein PSRP-3/Ycf65 [Helianthus annuus]
MQHLCDNLIFSTFHLSKMLSSLGMTPLTLNFTYKPYTFNSTTLNKLSTGPNFSHASTRFTNPKPPMAAAGTIASEESQLGVVVKPMEKTRLVLKFTWMDKNIGLALDQVIPGYGTIPVSPYYFWPRKDAWEELKVMLESKPWISQKQVIILLNQATDIINLWQQSERP